MTPFQISDSSLVLVPAASPRLIAGRRPKSARHDCHRFQDSRPGGSRSPASNSCRIASAENKLAIAATASCAIAHLWLGVSVPGTAPNYSADGIVWPKAVALLGSSTGNLCSRRLSCLQETIKHYFCKRTQCRWLQMASRRKCKVYALLVATGHRL